MAHRMLTGLLFFFFGVAAAESLSVEPFGLRLEGGASRCQGELQVKQQSLDWTAVDPSHCSLHFGNRVCAELGCGSALSVTHTLVSRRRTWLISPHCDSSVALRNSFSRPYDSDFTVQLQCSDSVRLISGSGLCSGLLQIHWNQSWTSVCEGALDLRDAQVVCRELGCGPPSLLQGALSEGPAPLEQMFHCEGHESALMDCPRSSSGTCSGTALHLSCSDPDDIRLVGGSSRCDGRVELKYLEQWREVSITEWYLDTAAALCRRLDCGFVLSSEEGHTYGSVWEMKSSCVRSSSSLRECVSLIEPGHHYTAYINCSDSVQLLPGPRLCSGLLQIHWDQFWTSVCEGALDLRDAQVVCRELGCGPPSLLQGALSEGPAPLEQMFHCEGHESALMDCPRSSSGTCSGTALHLSCSEPVLLVGGTSRCDGVVMVGHEGEWRPVSVRDNWGLEASAAVCRDLDCGSAVFNGNRRVLPHAPDPWFPFSECVLKSAALRECIEQVDRSRTFNLDVVCSDFMNRPNISLSVSDDGVSEAQPQGVRVLLGSDFRIKCSIEPLYPGGSFQLLSPVQNHTLPAVNHSAHFLFSDAGPAHTGNYTCVYHLQLFKQNVSSQSFTLQLSLGISLSRLLIRATCILLLKLMYNLGLYYVYCKATRGRQRRRRSISPRSHWSRSERREENRDVVEMRH